LTIRAETPQDGRRIAEVTTQAFGKEREAIVEEIRRSDNYVAEAPRDPAARLRPRAQRPGDLPARLRRS
jgi:hypothetical protein